MVTRARQDNPFDTPTCSFKDKFSYLRSECDQELCSKARANKCIQDAPTIISLGFTWRQPCKVPLHFVGVHCHHYFVLGLASEGYHIQQSGVPLNWCKRNYIYIYINIIYTFKYNIKETHIYMYEIRAYYDSPYFYKIIFICKLVDLRV